VDVGRECDTYEEGIDEEGEGITVTGGLKMLLGRPYYADQVGKSCIS